MLGARTHRIIHTLLLAMLGATMTTSVWAANLAWVLLGANWLLEGRWREKWRMAKSSRLLQAIVALYLLLVVAMLWTRNLAFGLEVLQVKLPLLCVPLVLLTTRPLEGRARTAVLAVYTAAVLAMSAVGAARLLTIPGLPYREAVPHISHIRFALNCCMVIYLAAGLALRPGRHRPVLVAGGILLALWMLAVLCMLRSYTAMAVLAAVALTVALARRRWAAVALWAVLAAGAATLIGMEAKDYYRLRPLSTEPLRHATANGRPYDHAQDGIIESGNYVNNYVCHDELRAEWGKRSPLPYDSPTASGYAVEPTLVRYLNALGLAKDSAGVASMSDKQIAAVERGVANPVYEEGNPLRRAVHTLLLEREFLHHTHAALGFTMLQRIALWEATLGVVRDHPWFGVGTGDVVDAMQPHLAATGNGLAGRGMHSHNQYLGLMAALGLVGFALLLALFLRPLVSRRQRLPSWALAWLLTILISMLTEDTLDTLAGILFCTFFLAARPPDTEPADTPPQA